jgi:hypothetical protein
MPLQAFKSIPQDIIQWSRYLSSLVVTPDPHTVTNDTFADRTADSVIGRPSDSNGPPTDIIAAADGRVLIRRAGTLQFDALELADLPPSLATDTDVAAALTTAESFSVAGDTAVTAAFQAADAAAAAAVATTLTAYDTRAVADTRNVLASTVLNGSTTYDPPSLADGTGTTTTVTVTGAALGDFALCSFSLDLQGIGVTAYVSAADTVSVRFQNESGGTLDLASGTLKARVWK